MKKRMIIMLICVGLLFGGIFGYQAFKAHMIKRFLTSNQAPTITVSAMTTDYSMWQPQLKATGSLRAIRGVNVTTELAGMVEKIFFTSGALVKEGTELVQLNADADVAQLHALQATAELANTVFKRDKAQYSAQAISKATLDFDQADLKSKLAQVAQQEAIVVKKTIHAPFAGQLGISAVNPGQYITPGEKIVALQALDPIYVDFYVPQQALVQLKMGQPVNIAIDTFPEKTFTGQITSMDPIIDVNTRNVQVEATLPNPSYELIPGMFATITVSTGIPQRYLTLPQTAISFNPYGNIIYVIQETGKDPQDKPILTVTQKFVSTGETRGDQIVILQGLKVGDRVVTSGQLKLKNGSRVAINNSVVPTNNPAPTAIDE